MSKEYSSFAENVEHNNNIRINLEKEDYEDIDEFFEKNDITSDEHYLNIFRAGVTRPRVFLKRLPAEKWHNHFNPFIFDILKSNTDIQFITAEYSCAAYDREYVNKTNRGISNLQQQIIMIMNQHRHRGNYQENEC